MIIPCKKWQKCGVKGKGRCAIGMFNKNAVSHSDCLIFCTEYDGPSRGRGDLITKLVSLGTLGMVTPCASCQQRRRDQNVKHPSKVLAGVSD